MSNKPSSLTSTMTGLTALQALATGNEIFDKLENAISSGGGGITKTISVWLLERLRAAFNAIIGFLNPTAPGAFGWLLAGPDWADKLSTSTYNTLMAHRSRLLWLQNTYIYNLHVLLTKDINNAHSDALRWTNISINNVTATINQLFNYTNQQIQLAKTDATNYTNKNISAVESKLTLLGVTLTAAIGALGTFLTTVVIPDAIEAAVIALNAEAAVAVDLKWEFVATTGNKAIAELTLADLDPLWVTNILSEIPAVSIADADADIISALKLCMDYLNRAGVPLYRNLKKFGEDTNELDGLLTTVLLGGFTAAAVADPAGTATVVNDVLGEPLNDILTAVAELVGLA
jgi:hypothetical protein